MSELKAILFNIMVYCPECENLMLPVSLSEICCTNSFCKHYKILYEAPTMILNRVDNKEK